MMKVLLFIPSAANEYKWVQWLSLPFYILMSRILLSQYSQTFMVTHSTLGIDWELSTIPWAIVIIQALSQVWFQHISGLGYFFGGLLIQVIETSI